MTPTDLELARRLVASLGELLAENRRLSALRLLAAEGDLLRGLLAHADALAADNGLLRGLVNDVVQDGPSAALLTQAAAQEREACCKLLCPWCRDGVPVMRISPGVHPWWYHLGGPEGYGCEAGAIRERGPCRPPLPPDALREENERLRGALTQLTGLADRVFLSDTRPGAVVLPDWLTPEIFTEAVERARAALEVHAGE